MDAINREERRSSIRKPGNTIEPVRLRLDDVEIVAKVQDISIAGIGILTHLHLEPGTWLVLESAKSIRALRPEIRAEVMHTTKLDAEYLVGCRFARYLTAEDIMALG